LERRQGDLNNKGGKELLLKESKQDFGKRGKQLENWKKKDNLKTKND